MSSTDKHESKRRCKASNVRGEPCKATIVNAEGYCPAHADGGRDMRALGELGGKARGRKQEQQPGDTLEGLAHAAIAELLANTGGSATARAAAARLMLDKVAAPRPIAPSSPGAPRRRRFAPRCKKHYRPHARSSSG